MSWAHKILGGHVVEGIMEKVEYYFETLCKSELIYYKRQIFLVDGAVSTSDRLCFREEQRHIWVWQLVIIACTRLCRWLELATTMANVACGTMRGSRDHWTGQWLFVCFSRSTRHLREQSFCSISNKRRCRFIRIVTRTGGFAWSNTLLSNSVGFS